MSVSLRPSDELRSFVPDVEDGDRVAVSVLTTMVAARAAAQAEAGLTTAAEAVGTAREETAALVGLDGMEVDQVMPADLTLNVPASAQERLHGAVLAGLSQLAADRDLPPEAVLDLAAALAEDFQDGRIDGINGAGEALAHASAMAPEDAMAGLDIAIANFLEGARNGSDMTADDYLSETCERAPQRPACL